MEYTPLKWTTGEMNIPDNWAILALDRTFVYIHIQKKSAKWVNNSWYMAHFWCTLLHVFIYTLASVHLHIHLHILYDLYTWLMMQLLRFKGGLDLKPQKFEHIFVAVTTFSPFLLCKYFLYQLVAYCVCFKMICKKYL